MELTGDMSDLIDNLDSVEQFMDYDLAYGRGMSTEANFQGIEYFNNLQDLEIDADELSQYSELGDEGCEMALDIQVDLSKNKKIKRFFCRAGSVEGLDLSQHHQLQDIYLYITVKN